MDNDHEGRHGTGLADQLWTSVVLEDRPCLMKASFSSRGYSLLLSDMEHFWSEEMNAEGVGKRLGELNRRLGAPVERVCEHLREAVGSLPRPGAAAAADREDGAAATAVAAAAAFSWTRREPAEPEQKAGGTVAVVALQSRMSGVPLRWEFRLSPAEHPAVWDELVAPALGMLRVLSRESAELRACIRRKDVEIADYRDSGARVSRKHLETKPFDDGAFTTEFYLKNLASCVDLSAEVVFDGDLRRLYGEVASARRAARKRKPSTTPEEGSGTGGHGADGVAVEEPGDAAERRAAALLQAVAPHAQKERCRAPRKATPKKKAKGLLR
ncbi:non-homologous end-joining factor 1 isoform X1 [Petromyzon marinus]|uniref:non-homologous end-joining factor 1 isoform X1 n=1 Tax=Petromyzon marinus TaxID=7757 RepID=UPI003F721935